MSTEEHKKLAKYIKNTHIYLRKESRKFGYEEVWKKHCQDEEHLQKYAVFMKKLATEHWFNNEKSNSKIISRINWINNFCKLYYFENDLVRCRQKENDILIKLEMDSLKADLTKSNFSDLKLLDVGSCYNPLKMYKYFDILPIDLCPASEEVFKCDFLKVELGKCNLINNNLVLQLSQNYFDVIVFSLLLEYLPSSNQRLICCEKAYELLKTEGILIIITPDSKHVGANAKFIKSWRFVLSNMGFSRIKYEKLPYLHCMVFRKCLHKKISQRWAKLHCSYNIFNNIYIPQDFQKIKDTNFTENDDLNFFHELPFS